MSPTPRHAGPRHAAPRLSDRVGVALVLPLLIASALLAQSGVGA